MSIATALSILLALTLGVQLSGCDLNTQEKTKSEFQIQDFELDRSSGRLRLSWSASPDARMYRVWIAKNSDCSIPLAQIATENTEHLFGRAAPGTYYGCVQSVSSFQNGVADSCTEGLTDVDGAGINAANQGMPLTVNAERSGRFIKMEGAFKDPNLVDMVGGIFISSGLQLVILNEQGQRLKQLQTLRVAESVKIRYAYTGSQIFAMSAGLEISRFYQWNDSAQTWTMLHEFPDQLLVAFHLVDSSDLSFVLRFKSNQLVQWHSLDPANPSVLKSSPALSSGADNWGYGYFSFASLYAEGAFVIADDRGLHRLFPDRLAPLAIQVGMEPSGIFFFPGAEAEYVINLSDRINLRAPSATPLICSLPIPFRSEWIAWYSKTNRWKKLPVNAYEGYNQLISAGPVSLPYLLGGKALQLMNGNKTEFYADLPTPVETLLPGPQLPQNRLLLSGGENLWLFEPDQR